MLFPYPSQRGLSTKDAEALLGPAYDLRNRNEQGRARITTTWVDDEEDEDYIPNEAQTQFKRKSLTEQENHGNRYPKRQRYSDTSFLHAVSSSMDISDESSATSERCVPCEELQLACSFITHPFLYPCRECKADDMDCELVYQPAWKRQCEKCRSGRKICSYRWNGYDHSQPCQPCTQEGFKCLAGPAKGKPKWESKAAYDAARVDEYEADRSASEK